ncbi:MAG: DUF4185 domain-containing protein [Candidatus Micrarchaeota archaeon]
MSRLVFTFVLLIFLFGCCQYFNKPDDGGQIIINSTNISQPDGLTEPEFVCELIDQKATNLEIKGSDLGIPLERNWIIFGDVFGTKLGSGGASAVLLTETPFDCTKIQWMTNGTRYYQPLKSKRQPGDESTVPAGAIEINGTLYLYSMRVDHWEEVLTPGDATIAHGILFKEQGDDFVEVFSWPADEKHANTAPVFGELNGEEVVFMAITGKFRNSPVYLAYVKQDDIENKNAYMYFIGRENNIPQWSNNISDATPLEGMENVQVGEVSLVENKILGKYYIMFQSYGGTGGFMLFTADTPYGPYNGPVKFTPCGTVFKPASWMESGWGGCYGGYIFPNEFGSDGKDVYYTVSVWRPYTTVVLKMRVS